MTEVANVLAANAAYAAGHQPPGGPQPTRKLAVVTCMDARIDVYRVLGLGVGEAHVIRNAGGRVTDDVLRSLAVSVPLLGADTVVVMQHTKCGLVGVTDEDLRERSGADVAFLPIADHEAALRQDIAVLAETPFLASVHTVAGLVYDVETGTIDDVVRWERPA